MENIDKQFLEDLEFRYRYLANTRYSRKQKDKFIEIFRREMNHMGISNDSISLIKNDKSINVVIGDVECSDIVIINNYDTPPVTVLNRKWHSLNWKKQQESLIKSVITMMLMFTTLMIGSYLVLDYFGTFNPKAGSNNYLFSIFAIISTIVMLRLVNGIGKKDNLQYTSPQIILDVLLVKELIRQKAKFTLILTDHGYQRHVGDLHLSDYDFTNKKVYYISDLTGDKVDIIQGNEENISITKIIPKCNVITTTPLINGGRVIDTSKGIQSTSLKSLEEHYNVIIDYIKRH